MVQKTREIPNRMWEKKLDHQEVPHRQTDLAGGITTIAALSAAFIAAVTVGRLLQLLQRRREDRRRQRVGVQQTAKIKDQTTDNKDQRSTDSSSSSKTSSEWRCDEGRPGISEKDFDFKHFWKSVTLTRKWRKECNGMCFRSGSRGNEGFQKLMCKRNARIRREVKQHTGEETRNWSENVQISPRNWRKQGERSRVIDEEGREEISAPTDLPSSSAQSAPSRSIWAIPTVPILCDFTGY